MDVLLSINLSLLEASNNGSFGNALQIFENYATGGAAKGQSTGESL